MTAWVLTPIPAALEVRELLSGLLGREVEVSMTDTFAGDSKVGSTFAVYIDDQERTRAVAVLDLPCSAYAGAAIGLIPVGGAEAALEEGDLPPVLRENLGEVLNVLASLLNAEGCPHVKLQSVYHADQWPEPEVAAHAATPGRRLDLEVNIPLYGRGRLSMVGVA
jgi:hypothetical protein